MTGDPTQRAPHLANTVSLRALKKLQVVDLSSSQSPEKSGGSSSCIMCCSVVVPGDGDGRKGEHLGRAALNYSSRNLASQRVPSKFYRTNNISDIEGSIEHSWLSLDATHYPSDKANPYVYKTLFCSRSRKPEPPQRVNLRATLKLMRSLLTRSARLLVRTAMKSYD
jgi:hypothetical protein